MKLFLFILFIYLFIYLFEKIENLFYRFLLNIFASRENRLDSLAAGGRLPGHPPPPGGPPWFLICLFIYSAASGRPSLIPNLFIPLMASGRQGAHIASSFSMARAGWFFGSRGSGAGIPGLGRLGKAPGLCLLRWLSDWIFWSPGQGTRVPDRWWPPCDL